MLGEKRFVTARDADGVAGRSADRQYRRTGVRQLDSRRRMAASAPDQLAKGIFKIDFLYNLSVYLLIYNVSFGIFNLLPFPPLDGSKILLSLFPEDWHEDFFSGVVV